MVFFPIAVLFFIAMFFMLYGLIKFIIWDRAGAPPIPTRRKWQWVAGMGASIAMASITLFYLTVALSPNYPPKHHDHATFERYEQ